MFTIPASRIARAVLVFGILISYAALGHEAVRVWRSDLTLWVNAIALAPAKPRPHLNYTKALFGAGRWQEAEDHYLIVVFLEQRRLSSSPR